MPGRGNSKTKGPEVETRKVKQHGKREGDETRRGGGPPLRGPEGPRNHGCIL